MKTGEDFFYLTMVYMIYDRSLCLIVRAHWHMNYADSDQFSDLKKQQMLDAFRAGNRRFSFNWSSHAIRSWTPYSKLNILLSYNLFSTEIKSFLSVRQEN